MTKLSKNFSFKEMIESQTARRRNIKEQFKPSLEIRHALQALVDNILQPVRDNLGCGIQVSSGFRHPKLNKMIGGSTTSQHCKGEAADLNNTCGSDLEIAKLILKLDLHFDQMIIEFGTMKNPGWIHVSHKRTGNNRRQILRAYKSKGRTKYRVLQPSDII